jgi:protein-tyrosine phosphatase
LWLGNAGDVRDLVAVRRSGVRAIVDLALNEVPLAVPRDLVYCRFPIVDGTANGRGLVRSAIETTSSLLRCGTPTLIFCSAGMSRTPAIAAGALALIGGRLPQECLMEVVKGAPADLSPAIWDEVVAAVQAIRTSARFSLNPDEGSPSD